MSHATHPASHRWSPSMESGFLMLSEVLESYELLNGEIVVLNSGNGDVERHLDHVLLACHLFVDSRNGCNGK